MAFNKFDLVINLPLEKRQEAEPFPSYRRSALFWLQKHVSAHFSNKNTFQWDAYRRLLTVSWHALWGV